MESHRGWNLKNSALTVLQVLTNKYRNADHQIQRDLRSIIRQFIDIKNGQTQAKQSLELLREGKAKLLSLKRDLSQSCKQQSQLYDVIKKRIHKIQETPQEEPHFQLESQLIQHLLSRGQTQKARQLQKALGEQAQYMFGIQTQLFDEAKSVCYQISQNNLLGVRLWADQNAHMLQKTESGLQFQIVCCEYINLMRMGQHLAACKALRHGISKITLSQQDHKTVSKLTYALADPSTLPPILPYLQKLLVAFKKSFSQIYFVSFDFSFTRTLSIGFSALKSVCCADKEKRNPELCPICGELASKITARIPMLTPQSSSLKCRINGQVMDEQNYPLALPSNHIYSLSGLTLTEKDNLYYCKMTETWYHKNQAKRVYFA